MSAPRPVAADYKHVRWALEGGAPSRVNAIGQSRDGFLWLGSVEGLFRFDGVTFERIEPEGSAPRRLVVAEVLGARSGDVWVGLARSGGVSVYRKGRLRDAGMPRQSREVTGLAEDAEGAIWVARGGRSHDTLARWRKGRWDEYGPAAGLPAGRVWHLYAARDGALWVALDKAVFVKPAGAVRFQPTGVGVSARASIGEAPDGSVWVSDTQSTRLVRPGSGPTVNRTFPHVGKVGGARILFDRKGRLWGTTWTDGVFQVAARPTPQVQTFTARDGLSSDQTHAVFEDREGNIWVGTEMGLDMLRPANVVAEPAIQRNSAQGYRLAATTDGTVFVSDSDTLYRIRPGGSAEIVLKTPALPAALCAGDQGSLWMTTNASATRLRGSERTVFERPAEAYSYGCAEDRTGRLWTPSLDGGLNVLENGVWSRWPLPPDGGPPANAVRDPAGDAVILFRGDPRLAGSPPFTAIHRDLAGIGEIESILPGRDAVFVSGAQGLARLAAGKTQVLRTPAYPWLGSINGLVQTRAGDTWAIGDSGIIRIRTDDLDAAFARPGASLPHQLFDFRDGLNSFPQKIPGAQVVEGGDGRIWFLTRRNVLVIDPARLARNTALPPVAIRAAAFGDHRIRDPVDLTLPAGSRTLTVSYAAGSLSVPSRVNFRYRLKGSSPEWVNAGNRREAAFTDLRPGAYQFEVLAANEDGVWNSQPATLAIRIPPTPIETWWFRAFCAAGVLLLLWILYALRLRRVSAVIRARLEERTAERERIARELHDTLLQGFQGLVMRFQAVAERLPEGDAARSAIDTALERADMVLIEGRDRMRDLRSPERRSLEIILQDLVDEQPFEPGVDVTVASHGEARPLHPDVLDEVVRITGEALFNAARHARAGQVRVAVQYGRGALAVTVRDNGHGFNVDAPPRGAVDGHFGLVGMRERARKMDAVLDIESRPGGGAQVRLEVPASTAYRGPRRGKLRELLS